MRFFGIVIFVLIIAWSLAVLVLYPRVRPSKKRKLTKVISITFPERLARPVDYEHVQKQLQLNSNVVVATKAAVQWWQSVFVAAGQELIVLNEIKSDVPNVQIGSFSFKLNGADNKIPTVRVSPTTRSICLDGSIIAGLTNMRLSVILAHAIGHVFELRHEHAASSLMHPNVNWRVLPTLGSDAETLAVRGLHLKGVEGVCRCCLTDKLYK